MSEECEYRPSEQEIAAGVLTMKFGRRSLGDFTLSEARRGSGKGITEKQSLQLKRLAESIDGRFANVGGNTKISEVATLRDVFHALDLI